MACGTWDDPFDSKLKAYLLSHALVRDQPEKENRGVCKLMYRLENELESVDNFDKVFLRQLAREILITDKTFLDQFQGQYMIQLDLLEYATDKVALQIELEATEQGEGVWVKFLRYK